MTIRNRNSLLDSDMPAQEMRLHMGEMTAQEMLTARAAIRWANSRLEAATSQEGLRKTGYETAVGESLADPDAAVGGQMTDLEKTIMVCAKALAAASMDDVEGATWTAADISSEGRNEAVETIIRGILSAKRAQDWTSRGGTIAHIAWSDGASATLKVEGYASLRDLLMG